jgi:hypothetical protein
MGERHGFLLDSLNGYRYDRRTPMKILMVLMLLLGICHMTFAQDVINKSGNKCPSGYRDGKGAYCYKSARYDDNKVVVKESGECPRGYRNGKGTYCYGASDEESVIVKEDGGCPRGYRDGPGKYCYP